jgi:predicted transcriptional regulator
MEKILKELSENFGIPGKELIILDTLSKDQLTAEKISAKTSIPKGRIYGYLNSLISSKLIEKSEKKPFMYFITNLDENIVQFLKHRFEDSVAKQNRIMHMLENRSKNFDEIDLVNSGDDFSFRSAQLMKEGTYIKNIVRHGSMPFSLYPEKSSDFLKVRNVVIENRSTLAHTTPEMTFMLYKVHQEAYKQGKTIEYIVEKSALDFHLNLIKKKLGEKFYRMMVSDIKARLETHNIKVYVIHEFIPMHTLITNKKVFLSLIHHRHTHGLIITNTSAVELYNNYFEDMKLRCKNISI